MNPIEIRLSGSGGQGLMLGALILTEASLLDGKKAAQSQRFEPLSRGGVSLSDVVVSEDEIDYPLVTELDRLIILDQIAVEVSRRLVRKNGFVLADSHHVPAPPKGKFQLLHLPLVETARKLGNVRVTNMVALGAIARIGGICGFEALQQATEKRIPRGYAEIGLAALREGRELAAAALK